MDVADLYREHAERMLVFFARRTYDAQTAVDLVGETFARAYASRDRRRGVTPEEAAGWVWGIARNVLLETLRKGAAERRALARLGAHAPVLNDDEQTRIEELAGLADLRGFVAAALDELSADQREALRLRVVSELEYEEVAATLGISEQAARARVSRGLRALALALDGAEGAAPA
jgi:RNA polymerase sigma factor (sigma-70 family)